MAFSWGRGRAERASLVSSLILSLPWEFECREERRGERPGAFELPRAEEGEQVRVEGSD